VRGRAGALDGLAAARLVLVLGVVGFVLLTQALCFLHERLLPFIVQQPTATTRRRLLITFEPNYLENKNKKAQLTQRERATAVHV